MIDYSFDAAQSILHLRPKAELTKEDFAQIAKTVDPHIEKKGALAGIIIELSAFPGWDSLGAMAAHLRFVRDHHKQVKKVAVVTDAKLGAVAEKLASHFVAATIKHFPAGQADAARKWMAQGRFPDIPRDQLTDAQKQVYDAIAGGPRGGVRGPFGPLLRSPELADRVQKLGEYLRFGSSLPARLNEMAILINARFWESKYEWNAHKPFALKAGLAESIVDDLAQNRRPRGIKPDEEIVYDVCTALHKTHFVDDALFKRALDALGERGVVDLIAVSGYYTLVSMVLNVAEIPLPAGATSPW